MVFSRKIYYCLLLILTLTASCRAMLQKRNGQQKFSGYMIFISGSDENFFMPDSIIIKKTDPAYLNNRILYRIEKAGGTNVLRSNAKPYSVTLHFIADKDSVEKQLQTLSIIPCDLFFKNDNINALNKVGYISFEFKDSLQKFNVYDLFAGDDMNIAEKKNNRRFQ